MKYHHRIATQQDLTAIVAIYNSTVASREVTADTEPVSVESRQAWFDHHNATLRPLWVVEQELDQSVDQSVDDAASPAIVGWLSYSDFYGRPAYAGTAEISIYIHEVARGKGIGRYLMEQALTYAPQAGVHTLLGFVFGHNAPSLKLFEVFGFERWANMPRVATLDGIERDLVILGKRVA
ncbi:N-acetyltransferase family protein [Glaciimonas sp. GNP009]|uniref:GNAT family N-acetyltransferase n=1 Tax=Glaciimonas sp. CA11.2 TaxID=3048601 RepID=UPI002AB43627|nr:N-acetyltransferase family protein [Glaciimonas sp. CA11.2]MDY7547834.1 N-acetyltransferase family protein [Glaciimonas sp. CA11.2]